MIAEGEGNSGAPTLAICSRASWALALSLCRLRRVQLTHGDLRQEPVNPRYRDAVGEMVAPISQAFQNSISRSKCTCIFLFYNKIDM